MIKAGTKEQLLEKYDIVDWLIIDMGFSRDRKSCGIKFNEQDAFEATYSEMTDFVLEHIQVNTRRPLNLMIEAPLSVSFTKSGNPTGRAVDGEGQDSRKWYVGAGAVAALRRIHLEQKR